MERAAGIEPATSGLGSRRSTAELRPLDFVRVSPGRDPIQSQSRMVPDDLGTLNWRTTVAVLPPRSFCHLHTLPRYHTAVLTAILAPMALRLAEFPSLPQSTIASLPQDRA